MQLTYNVRSNNNIALNNAREWPFLRQSFKKIHYIKWNVRENGKRCEKNPLKMPSLIVRLLYMNDMLRTNTEIASE